MKAKPKEEPKVEPVPEKIAPEDVEIVENTECENDFEENETIVVENETDLEQIATVSESEAAEILNAEADSVDSNMEEFENQCHEAWLAVQERNYQKAIEYLDSAKELVKKMQEKAEADEE